MDTSSPVPRRGLRGIEMAMSVCMSVCVCVRPMKTSMCNISVIHAANDTTFGMWTPDGWSKASHFFTAKSVDASWCHVASKVCSMLKYSDIYNESITNFWLHTPGRSMYSGLKCNVRNWRQASSVDIESNNNIQWRIYQKLERQFLSNIFSWEPPGYD